MSKRVLIIGGYGNFGAFIARRLSRQPDTTVIIAGRSEKKAKALAESLNAEWAVFDIAEALDAALETIKPDIVIHTSGPFQGQSYTVAEACIRHYAHYIDLADGRTFVSEIVKFDTAARAAGVLLVSGASSVPGLTSAIIDRYQDEFQTLDRIDYGIATAQKTNRGLATTKAVLSYAGKPFTTLIDGRIQPVYGWQGFHWRKFPGLGWRTLANCDVPDLALFPARYPSLKTIRFSAGLELPFIHLGLWALTWLVRIGLISNLKSLASLLLSLSRPFDLFGTDRSGFFMEMVGQSVPGHQHKLTFELMALSGDGPMIPCAPAIVIALGLARSEIAVRGAMPCVGLVALDALLDELKPLDIHWNVTRSG
jgi:saccharopine dehydrogenase-like NADP-dependent oxidoreductase